MGRFSGLLSKNREALLLLFILLFNLFFVFSNIRIGYNIYDDGITAYGASRVMHGEIPYRDFWTPYTPGNFYLEAVLFKLFGESLMVQRVYGGIVIFLIPLAIWLAARNFSSALHSLFAASIGALSFGFWGPVFGMAFTTAGLLFLLSLNFILRASSTQKKINYVVAGVLTGLTVLFKHDLGLILFFSAALYMMLSAADSRQKNGIYSYIAVTAGVLVPVGIYFLIKAPFDNLYEGFVRFPLEIFPGFMSLPFPKFEFSLDAFQFYYPVLVYALAAASLARALASNKGLSSAHKASALLLATGCVLFAQAKVRADSPHMFYPIITAAVLSSLIISETAGKTDAFSRFIMISVCGAGLAAGMAFLKSASGKFFCPYLLSAVFIIFAVIVVSVNEKIWSGGKLNPAWAALSAGVLLLAILNEPVNAWLPLSPLSMPQGYGLSLFRQANGILVPEGVEKNAYLTVEYLKANAAPDKKIFIGGVRHDLLYINNVLIYFFAARACATRYHVLDPGVVTTQKVQEEIINALIKNNVEYIVLRQMPLLNEPNRSSVSSGIHLLDNYIRQNYTVVVQYGPYYIMKLSPTPIDSGSYIRNESLVK